MSYATPADMLRRFDSRRVGDLVQDAGARVSASSLTSDLNLQAALDDGASLINASILRGGRYLPSDLAALAGVDVTLLLRLNCELAYVFLLRRRGYSLAELHEQAPGSLWAEGVLTQLANGELIFNVPAAINAGGPQNVQLGKQVAYLSANARRYFGDLDISQVNANNIEFPS